MTKFCRTFLILFSVAIFSSCGDDDTPQPSGETDVPYSVIGDNAAKFNKRRELPEIKDPSMFIVHYVDNYDVTYSIEWDKAQKTQRWSAYVITQSNITRGWDRSSWDGTIWKGRGWSGDPFQEDSIIPSAYRTTLMDYNMQQPYRYNRGHIVNSQDRLKSKSANGQTYYLSNIQPQLSGFNSGIWLNFENRVHAWGKALKSDEILYIVKGGTTQATEKVPQPFITDNCINIPVPRYFFMAILKLNSDQSWQAIGFWAEHKVNSDTNVKSYVKSINALEELTGYNFFHNLDSDSKEIAAEASYKTSDWTW